MRPDRSHLQDEELLRAADGELDPGSAAEVQAHLAVCASCQSRARALDRAMDAFLQGRQQDLDPRIPADEGPRALLRARLAAGASPRPVWPAGLALALGVIVVLLLSPALPWTSSSGELAAFYVPHAGLTPGSTVPGARKATCDARGEDGPPAVSRAVALDIFRTYGISDPRPNAYELDYLIAPELGGSADVRNLWPQPYSGTWNAHLKDALEEQLITLVCEQVVDLTTAQREIAADWVAAYKKYFQTDAPLDTHRRFLKDRPWR